MQKNKNIQPGQEKQDFIVKKECNKFAHSDPASVLSGISTCSARPFDQVEIAEENLWLP